MQQIKIKKMKADALLPVRSSKQAAGWDLYNNDEEDTLICPGETKFIHTGIAIEGVEGYFGAIVARSGLSTKNGLAPANKIGVIDSDYRGEIIIGLHNTSSEEYTINKGDRVAQCTLHNLIEVNFILTDKELSSTERNEGGLGHAGYGKETLK